jgi:DNA-binding PadR family transcriptional regulator
MSLKHSLLALLSREAKTGYELSKDVGGPTGFFWTATHQQIYRDLAELERKGWVKHKDVSQSAKPDKKIYSTTKDGLNELKRWLKEPTVPAPGKNAFLIKLFAGHLIEPGILLNDLLRHKKLHQAKLKRYAEIENEHFSAPHKLPVELQFQHLTLRRGTIFEKAWLTWCKETEAFLRKNTPR